MAKGKKSLNKSDVTQYCRTFGRLKRSHPPKKSSVFRSRTSEIRDPSMRWRWKIYRVDWNVVRDGRYVGMVFSLSLWRLACCCCRLPAQPSRWTSFSCGLIVVSSHQISFHFRDMSTLLNLRASSLSLLSLSCHQTWGFQSSPNWPSPWAAPASPQVKYGTPPGPSHPITASARACKRCTTGSVRATH